MTPLTLFAYGSIRLDEEDTCHVDAGEICSGRGDDGVEVSLGRVRDVVAALACARVGVDDDDLPAGELERPRMDPCEAELEDAAGPVSHQIEDSRRRGGGESRWKAAHRYARYMSRSRTGKFLGVPYDWSRPTWARYKSRWWNTKDRRIVMPRAFGWGYDFNFAEIARRLHLRG
jgi:hypothetical protein